MIGEIIKDFKVTSLLGRGGMGEVYVGTQQIVHTKVAIKLLREDISSDRQHVQRFFNEAITAGKIKHAGIVKIYDVGFHGPRAFLIMEYLEGESLATRIRRPPRVALHEIVDTTAQLASILEATHAAGITHRDLKPDNIFVIDDAELASKRRVKVLDFGIAKLASTGAASPDSTALTVTNSSMGTPAYMAPEQWQDAASADGRADVYSLGCVIFELCCSRPPFVVATMPEACAKHMSEIPPRIRSLVPELPAAIDELVAAMLAKMPEDRPTMAAVAASFAGLRVKHPVPGAPIVAAPGMEAEAATALPANAITGKGRGDAVDERVAAAAATTQREPAPAVGRPSSSSGAPRSRGALVFGSLAVLAFGVGVFAVMRPREQPLSTPASPTPGPSLAAPRPPSISPTTPAVAPPAPGCLAGMVRVPGGEFLMGTDSGLSWEKPAHLVTLTSAFCLDRTEVTVGAYASCVAKGACALAPTTVSFELETEVVPEAKWPEHSKFCNGAREDRADHPINCVSWDHAFAYCRFAGKRLPTEAEWERAARGGDDRRYPWGNEAPSAKRLNLCGAECRELARRGLGKDWWVAYEENDGWGATAPVGSFPDGASPFGALDMAGNLAEWTGDVYAVYSAAAVTDPKGPPTGEHRVARDSSWRDPKIDFVRSTSRISPRPTRVDDTIGFRCAGDLMR